MERSPGRCLTAMHYEYGSWALDVAAGWQVEDGEECVTFFREDGVGTFQISSWRKQRGPVTDDDLLENSGDYLARHDVARVACGDFTGWRSQYEDDGLYWRSWHLRSGPVIVFITYNCDADCRSIEDADVDAMLATLRRRDKETQP